MSDMTSLSHQYTANATFAEQINAWVLAIKKASLGVAPAGMPAREELDDARARLGALLVAANARLTAGAGSQGLTDEDDAELDCPEEVLERIQDKHKTDATWFAQDLQDTAAALAKGPVLEAKLMEVLDEFSDAADGLATESFRRLWRR
jgi:hypothetical protein